MQVVYQRRSLSICEHIGIDESQILQVKYWAGQNVHLVLSKNKDIFHIHQ